MKRLTLAALSLSLALALLAGCGGAAASSAESAAPAPADSASGTPAATGVTFTAATLAGEEVTEAVFADYDLTMVNVWATWCGYCVQEMPEIAALYDTLPDNVNILTVCTDADTEGALAQQILDDSGAAFTTLADCALSNGVTAFPTTLFYDKNGNRVGEAQLGVPRGGAQAGYAALIDQYLVDVGAAA